MKRSAAREWMPLHIDRWSESERVATMSPAAEALYMRLLTLHWRKGSLPSDLRVLKALLPAKFEACFDELWTEIRECFVERDGRLVNETNADEIERWEGLVERKREAGQRGNAARWGRPVADASQSDPGAIAYGSQGDRPDRTVPDQKKKTPPTPPRGGGEASGAAGGGRAGEQHDASQRAVGGLDALLAAPENADLAPCAAAVRDWAAHLGRRCTALVARNLLAKARELGPERFAAAVRHSIASGYAGLVEPLSARASPAARSGAVADSAAATKRRSDTCAVLAALWRDDVRPPGLEVDRAAQDWAYELAQRVSAGFDPAKLPEDERARVHDWSKRVIAAKREERAA